MGVVLFNLKVAFLVDSSEEIVQSSLSNIILLMETLNSPPPRSDSTSGKSSISTTYDVGLAATMEPMAVDWVRTTMVSLCSLIAFHKYFGALCEASVPSASNISLYDIDKLFL